jgi:hypothetical protein
MYTNQTNRKEVLVDHVRQTQPYLLRIHILEQEFWQNRNDRHYHIAL